MENPYQSPTQEELSAAAPPIRMNAWSAIQRLGLWLIVCSVSAAPSFIWGYNFVEHPLKIQAMALGIGIFAVAYTLFDLQFLRLGFAHDALFRRATILGFGIRLAVSVIFPLGMGIDLLPGLLSVTVIRSLWSVARGQEFAQVSTILAMTLMQGVLLNVILWSCILAFYGLLKAFARGRMA